MPVYMNWGGGDTPDIKGDVTEETHKDWIELTSLQWGRAKSVTVPTNPDRDTPPISEIIITKRQDSASAELRRASFREEPVTVVIDFVKVSGGVPLVYLQVKLSGVLISSYISSGGGDRPTESISLNFDRIEWGTTDELVGHDNTMPPFDLRGVQQSWGAGGGG